MRALGRADDGFTLIELLVTMTVLLIVISALAGSLISATNSETDLNNRFQTQQQARLALTKLTREIHCADTITDLGGSALTTTGASGLTLTLPAGCPTGGAAAVTAKWCTVTNGSSALGTLYDLYRSTTTTCSSSVGVRWATSLLNGSPFSLPATLTGGTAYPLVHLDLKVNTRKTGANGTYDLTDDIAALNSCDQNLAGRCGP
jgi:prepilin-type N-terminal cleavage/methylation domain-containing protein